MTLRSSSSISSAYRPGLGQRVGAHAHEQHLVGLAGPVDAHVGQRGRRQQAAERIEGLGPDRLAVDEVGVAGLARVAYGQPCLGLHQQLAVGVEHPVHVPHVAGPEGRVEQAGVAVVAVVAGGQPVVVGDVAGGLLEVGHQAAPLQHLGQDVGGLLAGQVDPAQLGHRVVAVLEEDLLVELLGPAQPHRGVHGGVTGDVQFADELVEEQAAQALGRAGVPGEQGPLDHLGQVDQGEYRLVEVGDVPAKNVFLVGGVRLYGVGEHARITLRRRGPLRRGPHPGRVVRPHHPASEGDHGRLGGVPGPRVRGHL